MQRLSAAHLSLKFRDLLYIHWMQRACCMHAPVQAISSFSVFSAAARAQHERTQVMLAMHARKTMSKC